MNYRKETVQATCSCKAIEIAQARLQEVYKTKERFSVVICELAELVALREEVERLRNVPRGTI